MNHSYMPNTILPGNKRAQCEHCPEWHDLEYFQGVDGRKLRYKCERHNVYSYIFPCPEGLDIPLKESKEYQKRVSDKKQHPPEIVTGKQVKRS